VHVEAMQYVADIIDERELEGDVLDLGGRFINGSTRVLFPEGHRYVVVDIEADPSVDIVADAGDLDLGETFDIVLTTELLEHTPRGADIVASAFRHLRPGGTLVATMAGPGRPPHGAGGSPWPLDGEWYRNVWPDELEDWLIAAGFQDFKVDQAGTDVRCWAVR
jgi:SAM-dependent methyltransferase